MQMNVSAPAWGEHRLIRRMSERTPDSVREAHDMTRHGVLANTRHDLGNLALHLVRLDLPGAVGDVLHAPVSLVRDVGNGVARTIDRPAR